MSRANVQEMTVSSPRFRLGLGERGHIFKFDNYTHTEIDNIYIYIVKETQTTKNKWIYYSVQPNSFAN